MENPALIVVSRQSALRSQMDVISNNLANLNTRGFRKEELLFSEFVSPKASNPGVRGDGAKVSFVGLGGTLVDTKEGALETTGNQLDLAIQGPGFFVVDSPNGPRYTRDGRFTVDGQGRIVNRDGAAVLDPRGRPLAVPPGAANIEVTASGQLSSDKGQIGSLQIVKFADELALQKIGTNQYQTDATPQPVDGNTAVRQGMVESSNVEPIIELTKMIQVQRAYEAASQMVNNEHDRSLKAIDILTRTN
jgi:flagellar basal-body rod protein FlgF